LKRFKQFISQYQLLFHLAIRELKIRYKYPFLGFLWMIFVPLSMVFVFKIVFSNIIKIYIPKYPFFIYLITGVFPWNYLATTLSQATTSLVDNSNLIKKVYFPREIVPISILFGNMMIFFIIVFLLLLLLPIFRIKLSLLIVFLPLVIIWQSIFIAGIILICSSLQVFYRDVKYIVEIVLLFWFYITPIFYPLSLVKDISSSFLKFYMLNPLTCLITLYRIILLPDFVSTLPKEISIFYLLNYTSLICVIFFILGFLIFRKYDRNISDFV